MPEEVTHERKKATRSDPTRKKESHKYCVYGLAIKERKINVLYMTNHMNPLFIA